MTHSFHSLSTRSQLGLEPVGLLPQLVHATASGQPRCSSSPTTDDILTSSRATTRHVTTSRDRRHFT